MSRLLWFVLGGIATAATAIGVGLVSVLQDSNSASSSSNEAEGDTEDNPIEDGSSAQSDGENNDC